MWIMYAGELDGEVTLAHLAFRAWEVRRKIALMFEPGAPEKVGWAKARQAGWKVVRVRVQKDRV